MKPLQLSNGVLSICMSAVLWERSDRTSSAAERSYKSAASWMDVDLAPEFPAFVWDSRTRTHDRFGNPLSLAALGMLFSEDTSFCKVLIDVPEGQDTESSPPGAVIPEGQDAESSPARPAWRGGRILFLGVICRKLSDVMRCIFRNGPLLVRLRLLGVTISASRTFLIPAQSYNLAVMSALSDVRDTNMFCSSSLCLWFCSC